MFQRIATVLLLVVLTFMPASVQAASEVDPASGWSSRVSTWLDELLSVFAADELDPVPPPPQEEPDQGEPTSEPQESGPEGGSEVYPGWDPVG